MHKAGFVNIVGNPNVGKSTLMNNLVGERISIITSKAQTTRHRIMGIVNGEDFQIVYSDTPGVLAPHYKLQESMLSFSQSALLDADILLYVTDTIESYDKHRPFLEKVKKLASLVAPYLQGTRLHVVPFTDPQLWIRDHSPEDEHTLMFRACMMKVANRISLAQEGNCIVTGEALSQVASQTLDSLVFTDSIDKSLQRTKK